MSEIRKIRKSALTFILMMGAVSLLADVTYEGARSITGPYLFTLGAGAFIVGTVSGAGEFAGYALRVITGKVADKTGRHWLMTFLGYILNLFSIPLLAFTESWETASGLIVTERIGKAIRTPSRDTLLSHEVKKIGTGWGFGIHQTMDQIGAVTGPLLITLVLYFTGDFRDAFEFLVIPAIMAMVILSLTIRKFHVPLKIEESTYISGQSLYGKKIRLYYLFVLLSSAGIVHFSIISYHVKLNSVLTDTTIPVLYSTLMMSNALFSMVSGKFYDRSGIKSIIIIPFMSMLVPVLSLSFRSTAILGGMIVLGGVIGVQDTMMRAAITDIVSSDRIATAFGMFGLAYGLGWFSGSTVMGFLYEQSLIYLLIFVIVVEFLSAIVLMVFLKDRSRCVLKEIRPGKSL